MRLIASTGQNCIYQNIGCKTCYSLLENRSRDREEKICKQEMKESYTYVFGSTWYPLILAAAVKAFPHFSIISTFSLSASLSG